MHLRENLALSKPTVMTSTLAVVGVAALWCYVRLGVFHDEPMHLSFLIPLFIVIWTRRHWHIWLLVVIFALTAVVQVFWVLPTGVLSARGEVIFLLTTLLNLVFGAALMAMVLFLLQRLETQSQDLNAQNEKLIKLTADLNHQYEEACALAEELTQQNEEMEAQAEELSAQNEELHDTNARLGRREEVLQNLLQFSGSPDDARQTFQEICQRTLIILGAPAAAVAIIGSVEGEATIVDHARAANAPSLPTEWTFDNNLLDLVSTEKRTAYVSDLFERPDMAPPFSADSGYRSLIATPISIGNGHRCALIACSVAVSHWSEDQFKVLEWLAAQCAIFMHSLRLHQALRERAAELEKANAAKDQFFAMLSHELRTPLTPVLSLVGVLALDERVPEDIRGDLEMIRRNVRIQSRLIDDLLDLARITQSKIELEWQTLSIAHLLKHSLQIVTPDLDAKNQVLDVELDGLEGVHVRADGARLQQVYWNLLKNAVKFSPVGAHITLRAEKDAEEVKISVSDHGCGLKREDVERIFLPFEQVHSTRGQNHSGLGLGLGLAIAKGIIEMHGGRIEVASEGEGKGSCFTVWLPIVHAEDKNQASPETIVARSSGVLNVLVVEDHVDTGLILTRVLRSMGYNPSYAGTAAEAYEMFTQHPFDLIISDLGLPDESGLELMRKMKLLRPSIRGICLSGFGMEEDRQACRDAGFQEHITKPVEIASLDQAIQRLSYQAEV